MSLLGRQKRQVEFLSAQLERQMMQRDIARAALAHKGRSFFTKPLSLLLPFSAGALATLLITRHSAREPVTSRSTLSIATLVSAASALWSATRPVREEFGFDPVERLRVARKAARSRDINGG